MTTRTARINVIRGLLRELGYPLPVGSHIVRRKAPEVLEQLPAPLRAWRLMPCWMKSAHWSVASRAIEDELEQFARRNAEIEKLREVPGIGLLTATALWAAAGSAAVFKSAVILPPGWGSRRGNTAARATLPGKDQQTRRCVYPHVDHPRRALRARPRQATNACEPPAHARATLGSGVGATQRPLTRRPARWPNSWLALLGPCGGTHSNYDGAHVSQRAVTL